ncbi:MAG: hypothetical protein IPP14_09130 [Planctomycetes bacterium]|nr:hypothetical protein [Planctomycetota bacterium]
MRVEFKDSGIRFLAYDFPQASVWPDKACPARAIRDADPDDALPSLRLNSGEVLFVTAEQKDDLCAWLDAQGVPIRRHLDVWYLLLEPFLDTEFSAEHQQKTLDRLEEAGLDRIAVDELRAEFGPWMYRYNITDMLWDWVHLGQCDLLCAIGRYAPDQLDDWYWRSHRIANLGLDRE